MNVPDVESSEKLDSSSPAFLHKIKFHMFQNISKCYIHRLIPCKYKNIIGLCGILQDKVTGYRKVCETSCSI